MSDDSATQTRRAGSRGSVEHAYKAIRALAINYELEPSQRINEVALAKRLGLSRTPIREALNRLVIEGLISAIPNRGFIARTLNVDELIQLYEVRLALETAAFRLACDRATDEEITQLRDKWTQEVGDDYSGMTLEQIAEADEGFHRRLALLSRNRELVNMLDRVNAQIRFCRMIDLENSQRHRPLYREHMKILDALQSRSIEDGITALTDHISFSGEKALAVIKEGLARIYLPHG